MSFAEGPLRVGEIEVVTAVREEGSRLRLDCGPQPGPGDGGAAKHQSTLW